MAGSDPAFSVREMCSSKKSIFWGLPSSRTWKSCDRRPVTASPFPRVVTTSTMTLRAVVRISGAGEASGLDCASRSGVMARSTVTPSSWTRNCTWTPLMISAPEIADSILNSRMGTFYSGRLELSPIKMRRDDTQRYHSRRSSVVDAGPRRPEAVSDDLRVVISAGKRRDLNQSIEGDDIGSRFMADTAEQGIQSLGICD